MGCTPVLSFLPSVGSGEWLVLLAVVLIVVGPQRLPKVARKIGRMLENFRRTADDFRRQIERMDEPPPPPPPEPGA
jgi:Tat protein translocase TatB subunit